MLQGYKWTKTDRIVHYLREIEVLRRVFEVLPRVPITEDRLVRNSLLKSAVYSARIEGIASTEQEPKLEAQNLLAAYGRIFSDGEEKGLSVDAVRKLHSVAMRNLSSGAGGGWGGTVCVGKDSSLCRWEWESWTISVGSLVATVGVWVSGIIDAGG